jgi:hypothetical protein
MNDEEIVAQISEVTIQVTTEQAGPQGPPGSALVTSVNGLAEDSATVHDTGSETIGGIKTFTSAPVVPSGAFPESSVSGLTTDLARKEPAVTATTSSDYYRGDKTFQPLNKVAVGLANVDNTSDASKPISTATQAALDPKQALNSNLTAIGGLFRPMTMSASARRALGPTARPPN